MIKKKRKKCEKDHVANIRREIKKKKQQQQTMTLLLIQV